MSSELSGARESLAHFLVSKRVLVLFPWSLVGTTHLLCTHVLGSFFFFFFFSGLVFRRIYLIILASQRDEQASA
jgi:hypothetical protein